MPHATKTLRDYQEKLVLNVCRATGDVLVEQPTGSGKTVQIVTLVAMHLGKRFSHAVIAAPQEQIEQGFVKRDYNVIGFPQRNGVAVPSIQVPNMPVHKALIKGARDSGNLGSVKRILGYLRDPGPVDHAFACTHAALNRITADDLPADLTGKALFIDEAHHASADGLAQLVTLWRHRGGQLFFFTATPYRGDGRPVRLEGMRSFRRSLAEHMAEGFAPRHLESEIVALGQPGDAITAGQFTGEEAPPDSYFAELIAALCRRWHDDGKPKTIIRVPPMQGGRSGELVTDLIQAFDSNGARVLDATGTAAADKQRFLSVLEAEKNQTFATSSIDVMVGIQRVLEGTDWPVCIAVYCVGMPGSLNTVVQFLGRAMRLKGDDYPAEQRDRAKLVFFVPCASGSALAELSLDHSRHALLTCCFLADHEVGQEWIVTREVRRGIEAALGPRAQNTVAIDAENDADEAIDPGVRAEVELAMADAREQLIRNGNEPILGEVVRLTARMRPDLSEAAIQRVAMEILAASDNPAGTAARNAIQREVATRLRIDPNVNQAMTAAFAVVLEEFRNSTLVASVVLESIRRQMHGITGGQMQEFAQRLRDAAPRPLTEEQILAWADAHHAETGEWVTSNSGPIIDSLNENWQAVDIALRQGHRGLAPDSSLAKLLEEKRGARNLGNLPTLSENLILTWADLYYQRMNQWPIAESMEVVDAPGEMWKNIDSALRIGLRGLPGGSSLAQLLSIGHGVRNRMALPNLTKDQILKWADAHYSRTGEWPQCKSGPVVDALGESWPALDDTLRRGARALPGGSSLAQLFAEERGVRNVRALSELTNERILAWADAHYQRTGKWPQVNSGPVHDAPDETWMNIHAALYQGGRRLPGGSSLAQLLAKERALRNPAALPSLTKELILSWADIHFERTEKWPKINSGPIHESPGETWANINAALDQGRRGLPGRTSLAQLLAEERGVQYHLALPHLTIEKILAWADSHYQRKLRWPKQKSGPIEDAPGETWAGIDASLTRGGRSLPSGSSLAQLLAVERGVRNQSELPPLRINEILIWADEHRHRTGKWPNRTSGPVHDVPGENWGRIDQALYKGHRGLNGGMSLPQLLAKERGV